MTASFYHWFSSNQVTNEIAVQTAKETERLLDPNYNYLTQLSINNLANIRKLNQCFQNYNQLNFEQIPILSEDQLQQTEYLLAGDAGEQLVDQTVKKLANSTKIIFHNVSLPYQYGNYRGNYDNQIDSLLITETGIYCIEVKVRKVSGRTFDFAQLEPAIYDQLTFHKEAVLQALQSKVSINANLIKTIVVIINRNGTDNFQIVNDQALESAGAKAVPLKSLDLVLSNGFGQGVISPGQITKINQAIWSSRIPDKRTYPQNICFNLNSDDLWQINLAMKYHLPIKHIITYNAKLNDYPLTGLSCSQQNFFWLIVGRLYRQKGLPLKLSRKELASEAGYRNKDYSKLDRSINKLTQFMQTTGLFTQASYKSGKITVSVKNQYHGLFNYCTDNFTYWNYQLLAKISNNCAKTLFRKLIQYAEIGSYECSFQEFRKILDVRPSYANHDVIKQKVEPATSCLASLFRNLSYEIVKSGKENRISVIKFTFDPFNPQELLSPHNWNQFG